MNEIQSKLNELIMHYQDRRDALESAVNSSDYNVGLNAGLCVATIQTLHDLKELQTIIDTTI